jgi:hypothetical protein
MDIENLTTEHTGSTAANTSGLSPGIIDAVNRSDRNADVSLLDRNTQYDSRTSTDTGPGQILSPGCDDARQTRR